ncbi:AI-2E family transporter [Glaciimonas sp. Gout2]|uniref:AI-2E family transporter n=1 Tax=unclassified Glaciimonas TaxID=2644401 RepID=UPI002AB44CE3|nr:MULTISPECIES: AI-2E family transporter [unclassified Glaciimonas]MDY7548610.1 AI-2E family transporter [Glaciimonas sp. CA11.2]MEB0013996.1 AI-2E family transporter [Glaciimonas sp. Cout2]MEB0084090.1 AI-2E family transporter [Glaciimonas sp. Gout2]
MQPKNSQRLESKTDMALDAMPPSAESGLGTAGAKANPEPAHFGDPISALTSTRAREPLASRLHVDARGAALAIIATVVFIFALQWAQKFLAPVVFGIFIAYTLNPVVVWLQRLKLPRVVATSIVLLAILGGGAVVTDALRGEFQSILEQLPQASHKLSRGLAKLRDGQPTTMQQMQAAANEIAKATGGQPSARESSSASRLSDWLLAGSLGAIGLLGQALVVLFLVFFLLQSGDTFKRKLVKLTGPSLSRKKVTVQILDQINTSIQNYMFMLLVTNILLALLMWIAFRLIGLQNAGAWAVAGGFLHIIPYFGSLLIAIATSVAAFMQFGTFSMMFLLAGISLGIAAIVGTFVTTWMTGKIAKMNPSAVFVALLFWGWLWGIAGLLVGIPIVVIIKVIAEHVEGMSPIAELLGE